VAVEVNREAAVAPEKKLVSRVALPDVPTDRAHHVGCQREPIVLDTVDPDAPFVVDNGCKELFMSPGESCLMRVIFRPDEPGFVANALTILFGSDLDSRFSETILLTGSTAIESPKASFPRPKKSTSSTGPSVC
jgi:hypothetical protein